MVLASLDSLSSIRDDHRQVDFTIIIDAHSRKLKLPILIHFHSECRVVVSVSKRSEVYYTQTAERSIILSQIWNSEVTRAMRLDESSMEVTHQTETEKKYQIFSTHFTSLCCSAYVFSNFCVFSSSSSDVVGDNSAIASHKNIM